MSNIMKSLYDIRILEELSEKRTAIHKRHPLAKLLTTFVYLLVTVSFGKYEVSGLLPLVFYPIVVMALADIPTVPILKGMLVAAPFIIGIGIFNPLFDNSPMVVLPWIEISGGWISFLSLLMKGALTVLAALILIATTGMPKIAAALTMLKIPKVFVIQLLLTYRYISVLMEEVSRTVRAYALRAPGEKGIKLSNWGSLTGQLLMRTLARAQRVYQAMCCRGFTGEYDFGHKAKIRLGDAVYFAGWSSYFLVVRYVNIPAMIGSLMTGVGR